MTKHRDKKRFNLLRRCLRDMKTGQLWLSLADRHKYGERFGELGVDVSQPFTDETTLLSTWWQSLSDDRRIVLYEFCRLRDPSLEPLVTDTAAWPPEDRDEYLLLCCEAKLQYLFDTPEAIRAWLIDHVREHADPTKKPVDPGSTGIVELNRALDDLIEQKRRAAHAS